MTQVHAGETWNVIPERATLRGTVRTFEASVQDTLETAVRAATEATAAAHRCTAELRYERLYPATVNDPQATERAARAAALVVGDDGVQRDLLPSMGSGGLRLYAACSARLLRVAGQWPDGRRKGAAQPTLRFQ